MNIFEEQHSLKLSSSQVVHFGDSDIKTKLVLVTPKDAERWLNRNTSNRPIRNQWIKQLCDIIKRGEWRVTHQGIAFDKDGNLLDGQHRLWAVVMTNTPVRMNVSTGVPRESFLVMDTGLRRTLSDLTALPRHEAEVLTRIARLVLGRHPSAAELLAYVPSFLDAVKRVTEACPGHRRRLTTATIRAAVAIRVAIHPQHAGYALEQFNLLGRMEYTSMTQGTATLCRQLQSDTTAREHPDATLIRAYRAFDPKSSGYSKLQIMDMERAREALVDAIHKLMQQK